MKTMEETIQNEDEEIIEVPEETLELELEEESGEDVEALKKQIATLKAQKEHFQKKSGKQAEIIKPKTQEQETDSSKARLEARLEMEEVLLRDKGYDDEDIEQLKKIAKMNNVNYIQATKDTLFVPFKDKKDAETKRKNASLGASSGSGSVSTKPISQMTREEHMAFVKED